jgi:parallel beta-helix repeat protein
MKSFRVFDATGSRRGGFVSALPAGTSHWLSSGLGKAMSDDWGEPPRASTQVKEVAGEVKMREATNKAVGVVALLAVAVLMPTGASAETTRCRKVTSIPTTISSPGIYCLKKDLVTNISTGNAIEIAANNVTVDLNGYKLGGLAAGTATSANGIVAYNRQNISIRNGTIRGFGYGVKLGGGGGHLVEDLRLDHNRVEGIRIDELDSTVVRNNRVIHTESDVHTHTYGIYVSQVDGCTVIDNDVVQTMGTENGYGISARYADNSTFERNRISQTSGDGLSYGLFLWASFHSLLVDNRILGLLDVGLYCNSDSELRDNLVSPGVTTAYSISSSCVDSGNNH